MHIAHDQGYYDDDIIKTRMIKVHKTAAQSFVSPVPWLSLVSFVSFVSVVSVVSVVSLVSFVSVVSFVFVVSLLSVLYCTVLY